VSGYRPAEPTTPSAAKGMIRPRAADDFATIRGHMEELRREREGAHGADRELKSGPPIYRSRNER
jgi:hypothetical protein